MSGTSDAKSVAIADTLRARIQSGDLAPGELLPSAPQLAADHQVALMTARTAVNILKSEGLVEARKGSGTRVRSGRPLRRRGASRLSSGVWQAGRSIWSTDLDGRSLVVDQMNVTEQPATAGIAHVLDVAEGSALCVRSRRYVLDDRPVQMSTSYLALDLVAGTAIVTPDTGPGGTYARLAEIGHAPARFVEELRCRMPSQAEVRQLDLAGGPVIQLIRTAYTAAGKPVEMNEMIMDAGSYILEYAFDA